MCAYINWLQIHRLLMTSVFSKYIINGDYPISCLLKQSSSVKINKKNNDVIIINIIYCCWHVSFFILKFAQYMARKSLNKWFWIPCEHPFQTTNQSPPPFKTNNQFWHPFPELTKNNFDLICKWQNHCVSFNLYSHNWQQNNVLQKSSLISKT